ncbi:MULTISPECIES: MerR family transcriptional regulator [unclassified Nocardia]|uniref:MerR family transcriptional regulator n=1 Tax=unclassified Nocardia TaxID=2637762 RepID=UPI001CE47FB4|nr:MULTISPECIES: MerR family transcriptional regulator [unclassified Nocardia]
MLIGELAERVGTSTRTLRYYEQHGLVRARRSANGYRIYDETELPVVHEIRTLLAAGFDLAEIQPFVACLRATAMPEQATPDSDDISAECADSREALRRKLDQVDATMGQLAALREQLLDRLRTAAPKCEFR